jgi:hypothetical protein
MRLEQDCKLKASLSHMEISCLQKTKLLDFALSFALQQVYLLYFIKINCEIKITGLHHIYKSILRQVSFNAVELTLVKNTCIGTSWSQLMCVQEVLLSYFLFLSGLSWYTKWILPKLQIKKGKMEVRTEGRTEKGREWQGRKPTCRAENVAQWYSTCLAWGRP